MRDRSCGRLPAHPGQPCVAQRLRPVATTVYAQLDKPVPNPPGCTCLRVSIGPPPQARIGLHALREQQIGERHHRLPLRAHRGAHLQGVWVQHEVDRVRLGAPGHVSPDVTRQRSVDRRRVVMRPVEAVPAASRRCALATVRCWTDGVCALDGGQPRHADARAQRLRVRGDRRARIAKVQLSAPSADGVQKDPVVGPLGLAVARQRPNDTCQPFQPRRDHRHWRRLIVPQGRTTARLAGEERHPAAPAVAGIHVVQDNLVAGEELPAVAAVGEFAVVNRAGLQQPQRVQRAVVPRSQARPANTNAWGDERANRPRQSAQVSPCERRFRLAQHLRQGWHRQRFDGSAAQPVTRFVEEQVDVPWDDDLLRRAAAERQLPGPQRVQRHCSLNRVPERGVGQDAALVPGQPRGWAGGHARNPLRFKRGDKAVTMAMSA